MRNYYRGHFEMLVLHDISAACIVSSFTLDLLRGLTKKSGAVNSFLQMKTFETFCMYSVPTILQHLEFPAYLDETTGIAVGAIAALIIPPSPQPNLASRSLSSIVSSLLSNYAIPGYETWHEDKEFMNGLFHGFRIVPGSEASTSPQTPSQTHLPPLTPPRSGDSHIKKHIKRLKNHNRSNSISREACVLQHGDIESSPAQTTIDGYANTSILKTEGEWVEIRTEHDRNEYQQAILHSPAMSDVVGSESSLFEEAAEVEIYETLEHAAFTPKADVEERRHRKITLTVADSDETESEEEGITRQSMLNELGRCTNSREQGKVREALLHAWLFVD